ncbi:hypothetical protein [Fluviicola taffensis]|uniref:hypothetical protein n=1 Tax=Fluviicola taffensis TaxID=191579 RepID=UPI003137B95D
MEVNIFWVVGSAIGSALITYLTTYTNAKAKFQAELETKAKITEEQERVIAAYKLDHEKRKYQYEKKHEVYSKYHGLLDKFDSEKNPFLDQNKMNRQVTILLNAMSQSDADDGKKMEAINLFYNSIDEMVQEALGGIKEIAKETNELKLIATPEIVTIVESIQANYDKVGKISNSISESLKKIFAGEQDLSPITSEVEGIRKETEEKKAKLIELMRLDIDKI